MSAIRPTPEQQAAVDAFVDGGTVVVEAGAGTGKTSTLRLLAGTRPRAKGLYLAFNKAIQTEAARSFPRNVECRTAHSLAYRTHGAPMRARLNGPRVPSSRAAAMLRAPSVPLGGDVVLAPAAVASMALRSIERFCRSADPELLARHVPLPPTAPDVDPRVAVPSVLAVAKRAWGDLTSPSGSLKVSHDVYLKCWQRSQPTLDYDFILFDEAQDADPAIADVVCRQDGQLVCVGDSAQAIFSWRGAVDFLERVEADHRVALTQSWRFGDAVADEANLWLAALGSRLRLTGAPHRSTELAAVDAPDAVLCRTNAGCVAEVLAAHEDGVPVALVGGGEDIVALARAARQLQTGQPVSHPELVGFTAWADVQHYAEHDPAGSDLAVAVKLIDRHGPDTVIAAIRACVPEGEAERTISTAHKAKGREWASVLVADDFREPAPDPDTGEPGPIVRDEAMLAYVTVTRAMGKLDVGSLAWIHDRPEPSSRSAAAGVGASVTAVAGSGQESRTHHRAAAGLDRRSDLVRPLPARDARGSGAGAPATGSTPAEAGLLL